jgi:hypothetical protein
MAVAVIKKPMANEINVFVPIPNVGIHDADTVELFFFMASVSLRMQYRFERKWESSPKYFDFGTFAYA